MEQADALPPPQPHITSFSPSAPCQGRTHRGKVCHPKSKSRLYMQHNPIRTPLQPAQRPFDSLLPISKNQRNSHIPLPPSPIPYNAASSTPPLPPSPSLSSSSSTVILHSLPPPIPYNVATSAPPPSPLTVSESSTPQLPSSSSLLSESSPIPISIPPLPHVASFSLFVPCQGITKLGKVCGRISKSSLCAQHDPNRTSSPQPRSRK